MGGERGTGKGYFFRPTVLANVTADMAAFREETFGPVAAVVRVSDASYLREYVWRYYSRPAWGSMPPDLRIDQFNAWARDNLATHVPFTAVRLEFPTEGSQPKGVILDSGK